MPTTRALLTLSLVAALVVGVAHPVAADDDSITFFGGGFGHGVGMGQYGAYGMSKAGATADEIIRHYYTGVAPGALGVDVTGPDRLWVNILQETTGVEIRNETTTAPGFTVTFSANGSTLDLAPGESAIVNHDGAGCIVVAPAGDPLVSPDCTIDGSWDGEEESPTARIALPSLTKFGSTESQTCTHTNWNQTGSPQLTCRYARGTLHIRPDNNTASFNLVMEMDIDDYILGISEMPYFWGNTGGQAALEAQAIAARSYAVRRALDRGDPANRPWCWCGLFDTTVDQNYVGWGHGQDPWIAATDTTAAVVYWHEGDDQGGAHVPIQAFYSSSTFGATEPNEIGFGGTPVPYLRSVPDPHSATALNPYATWTKTISLSSIAAALGIGPITTAAITEFSPSGAASKVTFFGPEGPSTWNTRSLRTPLGLRSPQITGLGVPATTGVDSVGLHDPATGLWHLRTNTGNTVSFYYGNPLDIPYSGDWDNNGITTLGLYRQSTGFLFLRNSNTQGIADIDIYYGDPGDIPIAGDWDGDGDETVGIFRSSEATVYLRNSNTQGVGDLSFMFGEAGDVPIAGDWNNDGRDTVALWRPSTKQVFFDYGLDGVADFVFDYLGAEPTDRIVAGDWNGDGIDTVGIYRPGDAKFYLRDTYTQAGANIIIEMGEGHMSPIAGAWGF